jgi:hypothetical protein
MDVSEKECRSQMAVWMRTMMIHHWNTSSLQWPASCWLLGTSWDYATVATPYSLGIVNSWTDGIPWNPMESHGIPFFSGGPSYPLPGQRTSPGGWDPKGPEPHCGAHGFLLRRGLELATAAMSRLWSKAAHGLATGRTHDATWWMLMLELGGVTLSWSFLFKHSISPNLLFRLNPSNVLFIHIYIYT